MDEGKLAIIGLLILIALSGCLEAGAEKKYYVMDMDYNSDANFSIVQAITFFGDGSNLTGITNDVDGGSASSVYLPAQNIDGGNA